MTKYRGFDFWGFVFFCLLKQNRRVAGYSTENEVTMIQITAPTMKYFPYFSTLPAEYDSLPFRFLPQVLKHLFAYSHLLADILYPSSQLECAATLMDTAHKIYR